MHRSTIWRWKQKWDKINENVQLENYNRPQRNTNSNHSNQFSTFRLAAFTWHVPTDTSRPHTSPSAVSPEIVQLVLMVRKQLKRYAEVVWHHLAIILGASISLSSVRRILWRHHCFDGARKKRVRPNNPGRPHVTRPGELVQTKTIHYVCPITKQRRYVYTIIDLYSRMAYAEVHSRILPGLASQAVRRAQTRFGLNFSMVQADNGLEFGRYFEQTLGKQGIGVRHSRLGRPNDNAHIERFNRTIQEECLGSRISSRVANATLQTKIDEYVEFYNTKRIHLGLQLRTPGEMLQRF